jgi:hypothetical protein
MKRIISFMLSLLLAFSLVACSFHSETIETTDPETSIEILDTEEMTESDIIDLSANAETMLRDMSKTHLCDDTFVDVVMTNVPDVFMLTDINFACWTYFLIMSDGIEYIITTDENGRITTISYWDGETGTDGPIIYTLNE